MIETLDHFDPHVVHGAQPRVPLDPLLERARTRACSRLVNAEWGRLGHLRDSTFSFVPGRAQESVREHENILVLIETGRTRSSEIEKAARRHRSATLDAYLIHEHPDEALGLAAL